MSTIAAVVTRWSYPYILETSRAEPAAVRALLVRQVGREVAEKIMTTAERLRREGEAVGEVRGKRGALLLLLRERFGRIPGAARARIEDAGAAELDVWFRRGLTASSLDEVMSATAKASPRTATPPARPRSARRRASV